MDPRSNGKKSLVAYLSRLPATRVLSTSEDNREEAEAFAAILRKEMGAGFQEVNDRRTTSRSASACRPCSSRRRRRRT